MKAETEAAIREFIATAEGWCTLDRALEFGRLILDVTPEIIVETGVFAGGSLIPMALALKEIGHGKIYGIDPWRMEAAIEAENELNQGWWKNNVDLELMQRLTIQAIWKYELEPYAVIIRARSEHCHELFRDIDLWNCDANHSEEASCRDVELYAPRIKSNGLILFDDSHWPSTQRALSILQKTCEIVKDAGSYHWYRKI